MCGVCLTAWWAYRSSVRADRDRRLQRALAVIDAAHAKDPSRDPNTGEAQVPPIPETGVSSGHWVDGSHFFWEG